MKCKYLVSAVLFCVFSAINPAYILGCGNGDVEFQYDAEDMEALLDAASTTYLWSDEDGNEYKIFVELQAQETARGPSAFGSTAHACESRKVMSTASACYDSSTMSATGSVEVIELNGMTETPVLTMRDAIASLTVIGTRSTDESYINISFASGVLTLESGPSNTYKLKTVDGV